MDELGSSVMSRMGSWKLAGSWRTSFLIVSLLLGLTQSAPGGNEQSIYARATTSRGQNSGNEGGHRERHRDQTMVQTSTGKLRGVKRTVVGKDVFVYLGIPFAKPPVGDLRFKKPEKNEPWDGVYQAVNLPNTCYQEKYSSFVGFRGEEMWNPNTNISEDCLYMNLWAPRTAVHRPEKKLPILVWIYGGGYMSGTISLDVYNADILAAENDVIIVSINYRVGAFGFLFLNTEDAPGNQGMYDQVMALEWIRQNAHAFGGDPESVTMFGESAGGGSVTFHLLSPISRHLITRGIIQSGTLNAPWSVMEAQEAQDMANELFMYTGCNNTEPDYDSVKCLRELPASTISEQQWNSYKSILAFPSRPTIDGVFLPQHPMDMLKAGDFKRTQLLIGSNKNEGTYFLLYDFLSTFNKDSPVCLSRDKFLEIITTIFPDRSKLEKEAILFQYTNWEDLTDTCKNTELVGDLVGDYFFICPSNAFAQAYAAHGNPVYYYFFTHRSSTNPWGKWMGVMHGDEVEYVFGHPLNNSGIHSSVEQNLSRKIMSYFTRFARTGRPDQHAVDSWPLYTKNEPHYFILNADPPVHGKGPRSHHCAFWNEFMPLINSGTTPLRSKCDKEIWGPPSSAALSHPAKSFHIVTLMFSFVVVNIFYWNIPSYSKFFHTPHHIG